MSHEVNKPYISVVTQGSHHPLALPMTPVSGKPVIDLRERTSHTATMPSWNATANLEHKGEKAVQNGVGSAPAPCYVCTFKGVSKVGRVISRERGVKVIRALPVMPCRYTCGESPTI